MVGLRNGNWPAELERGTERLVFVTPALARPLLLSGISLPGTESALGKSQATYCVLRSGD